MLKNFSVIGIVEQVIFAVRWILVPMYIGLYIALAVYNVDFFIEIGNMVRGIKSSDVVLIIMLSLVDIIMVGQLVVMTTIGGYTLFVKEFDYEKLANKPRWLNNLTSVTQKVKLGMSLMGVSTVHLLSEFLSPSKTSFEDLVKQLMIIIVFMAVTYWYGLCDKLVHPVTIPEHH